MYPEVRKWTTEPKKLAQVGDVLISVRAPVGPTNIAPFDCSVGRGLAALRAKGSMPMKYLLYPLGASSEKLASQATGTTFPAISGSQLRGHNLPIAPPDEQQRIVEAIEEQFSRLDGGVESIQRAKRNLARLRGAVLKAAVDGRLPIELDARSWKSVQLGEIVDDIEAGKSFKATNRPASQDEWGVIKVSAMTWGRFNPSQNKALLPGTRFDDRFEIRDGDLLLSRANTSGYVGATVLVEIAEDLEGALTQFAEIAASLDRGSDPDA